MHPVSASHGILLWQQNFSPMDGRRYHLYIIEIYISLYIEKSNEIHSLIHLLMKY